MFEGFHDGTNTQLTITACMQGKTVNASQMTMHIWEMIRSSGRK